MARKAKGKEIRATRSIRIEPAKRDLIEKRHGTFQKWVDQCVEKEISALKGVKLSKPEKKEKLSPKMKSKVKKLIDEMF